jgi:hypothetical protein
VIRKYLPRSTEELIHWYERYVSPFSLLVGFLADIILVKALDLWQYSFVLLFHLALSILGILALHYVASRKFEYPLILWAVPFIPVAIQFSFGGLFSGFVLLYSRSAGLAVNWIFIALLAVLLLGNERFRRVYTTLPVQLAIWYVALFSFLIIYAPVISKVLGPKTFIAGGVMSLVVAGLVFLIAKKVLPEVVQESRAHIVRNILGAFFVINVLYFSNAIPPLPLALKDAGVFHSITRTGKDYTVSYEPIPWQKFYWRYNKVFNYAPGETVYVYTAVFAPAGISTTLIHEWQRYDAIADVWVTEENIGFAISGGRDGGYRGYTLKRDVMAGEWRVNVKTVYGPLVGRASFEVVSVSEPVPLETGER